MYPFDLNNRQGYSPYGQADVADYSRANADEAMYHLQQFMMSAPPHIQQDVFQQYFQQMPPEQRMELIQQLPPQYDLDPNSPQQMAWQFSQMGQRRPDMLQQLFSQFGPSGNPLVKAAAVGVAALVAQKFLSNSRKSHRGGLMDLLSGHGGGLGNVLSGLFGEKVHRKHWKDDHYYYHGREWDDDHYYKRRGKWDDDYYYKRHRHKRHHDYDDDDDD